MRMRMRIRMKVIYYLEKINNNFKEINETKSFKDQINILKKNTRRR